MSIWNDKRLNLYVAGEAPRYSQVIETAISAVTKAA